MLRASPLDPIQPHLSLAPHVSLSVPQNPLLDIQALQMKRDAKHDRVKRQSDNDKRTLKLCLTQGRGDRRNGVHIWNILCRLRPQRNLGNGIRAGIQTISGMSRADPWFTNYSPSLILHIFKTAGDNVIVACTIQVWSQ